MSVEREAGREKVLSVSLNRLTANDDDENTIYLFKLLRDQFLKYFYSNIQFNSFLHKNFSHFDSK